LRSPVRSGLLAASRRMVFRAELAAILRGPPKTAGTSG
jgi:hypothetical protein